MEANVYLFSREIKAVVYKFKELALFFAPLQ